MSGWVTRIMYGKEIYNLFDAFLCFWRNVIIFVTNLSNMKYLKIHNFGPIKEINLQLKGYNFFIGGQGVGKSTLAKLLSIVSDYNLYFHLTHPTPIKKWNDFLRDYAIQDFSKENSVIEYQETGLYQDTNGTKEYTLSFYVKNENTSVEMKCENDIVTGSKFDYILSRIIAGRKQTAEFRSKPKKSLENIIDFQIEILRDSLYIPAERIMYASFTKLLPALNLVQETISKNLLYFSIDYNNAKSHLDKYTIPMLGIDFVHEKEDDYIILANEKRLPLKVASSGMQSVIPLLLTLDYATTQKHYHSYVIEEPECNLFPKNQIQLIDSILQFVQRIDSCLSITTHSPYIINYLNLLIRRHYRQKGNGINPEQLTAYYINDSGEATDLMAIDNQTKEIIVNTIDLSETMGNIYNEYSSLK